MGYNVGNLELDLEVKNIDAAISKFESLSKTINSLNGANINIGGGKGGRGLLEELSPKKFASAFNFKNVLNQLYAFKNVMKPYIADIKKIVTLGVDYTETLNLWQVAMGKNVDLAEEFVTKMNKAYGIATETLMKYQATFSNMLSSLGGISDDMSYALSESIMQLAVDYASLYNTATERAMTLFQQVLAGQTKSIRSASGYDITENTIYELYQQLGGTKTMRQLSQTEKRLLRIYAVYQQMERSGAIGDLRKTIDYTANQLRMIEEGWKEFTLWVGKWVEQIIKPILPYINAALITAKEILKSIVTSLPQYEDFDGAKSGVDGLIGGLEDTEDEIDKVQGKLLGFDKFRALNSSDEESSIDDKIFSSIIGISNIMEGVTSRAQELAAEWLAFIVNPNTGEFTDELKNILGIISAIGTAIVSLATRGVIEKLFAPEKIKAFKSGLKGLVSPLNIVLSLFAYMLATNENFRKSIGTLVTTIGDMFIPIFEALGGALLTLCKTVAPIIQIITDFLSWVVNGLDKLGLLEAAIWAIVGGLVAYKITMAMINVHNKLANFSFLDLVRILQKGVEKANDLTDSISKTQQALTKTSKTIGMVGAGMVGFFTSFSLIDSWISGLEGAARTTVSVLGIVFGALVAVLGVVLAIKEGAKFGLIGAGAVGLGLGAFVAGIKGVATANMDIAPYKNGGVVEDGIFTMSKGEIIGNFDDGTTVVANNQQIISGIEQGVYKAVSAAMQGNNGGRGNKIVYNFQVNGRTLLSAMEDEMHKQGKKLSRH